MKFVLEVGLVETYDMLVQVVLHTSRVCSSMGVPQASWRLEYARDGCSFTRAAEHRSMLCSNTLVHNTRFRMPSCGLRVLSVSVVMPVFPTGQAGL